MKQQRPALLLASFYTFSDEGERSPLEEAGSKLSADVVAECDTSEERRGAPVARAFDLRDREIVANDRSTDPLLREWNVIRRGSTKRKANCLGLCRWAGTE